MTYSDYCNNILIFLYDSRVEKEIQTAITTVLSFHILRSLINLKDLAVNHHGNLDYNDNFKNRALNIVPNYSPN